MSAAPGPAPLVLAEVRLADGREPVDLVLSGGRVARVAEPGTAMDGERLPLDGARVLPGLWDHHVHMEQWALTSRRLDLSAAGSAAEAVRLVREALAAGERDPGELVVGFGFRDALWPDAPGPGPLDHLDRPGRAVVLLANDLHCAWVNRAAMARAGVPEHPGGLLRETEMQVLDDLLTGLDAAAVDRWVLDAARAAARRGVVGIVDLEAHGAIEGWARRAAAGPLPVRVRAAVRAHSLEEAAAQGLRTGTPLDAQGRVEAGPLKVISDGSLSTRTAWCHEPYPETGGTGEAVVPPAELEALLRRGLELGFAPAVHAIGDAANTAALDVFATLGARGSIEHAQLLTGRDVSRMAALGVTASVQPAHLLDDRDVAEHHWAGRTHRAFPLRDLLDAGARVVFGSDAPVAPLDPWQAIQAAVERTGGESPPWHPEQRVSLDEAIAASTPLGRAEVRAGDPADLVVVPGLAGRSSGALRDTPVLLTFLGGEVTADLR